MVQYSKSRPADRPGRVVTSTPGGAWTGRVTLLRGLAATHVLSYIVYRATPRDPLVLAGVVFTMFLLGLLATWIPAARALTADPLVLLRED